MRIDGIVVAFVGVVLVWEALKLFNSWKHGATTLAGIRFGREASPKRYWSLVTLHAILWIFILAVFLSLLTGIQP